MDKSTFVETINKIGRIKDPSAKKLETDLLIDSLDSMKLRDIAQHFVDCNYYDDFKFNLRLSKYGNFLCDFGYANLETKLFKLKYYRNSKNPVSWIMAHNQKFKNVKSS